MDYKELGKRIRKYRKAAHLTQSNLAEIVECSDGHISQIERAAGIPSLETVVRIANALQVSLDQLVVGSLEEPEKYFLREIAFRINAYPPEKRTGVCEAINMYLDSLEMFERSRKT